MAGVLDKIVNAASAVGSKMAAAPDSDRTAEGVKAKAANVKEYMDAVAQKPVQPKTPAAGANVDKLNKNAKYGDRPGENRNINVSDMTKPLGSYKKGTTSVPKTGPAMLHKGEAVIPAQENPMAEGLYDKVPGMPAHKPKKEIDHIVTRKAKTGGYIHDHHHTAPEHHKMEQHVSANMKALHKHFDDHMAPEPDAAPDAGAAAGAPPAMGAPPAGPAGLAAGAPAPAAAPGM